MKKYFLTVLILLAIPSALIASTYGKPYGSDDATEIEKSDVKTIDQINRSTEIEDEGMPLEQEAEQIPATSDSASVPDDDSPSEENELSPLEKESPSFEQQDDSAQ